MAVAILRKPDAAGVRIDVAFSDRSDAEMVWLNRGREGLIAHVETRVERGASYKIYGDADVFMMDAAAMAAREYLKRDVLDEQPPSR